MRKTIICNPGNDAAFKRLVDQFGRRAHSPADLERVLRAEYPGVRVVDGIANGFGGIRWYAYRDGHWIASEAGERRSGTADDEH